MANLKKKGQGHLKELYGILYLSLGVFFGLCLLSYNPADPALNAASNIEEIGNLGGVVGAYLADLLFTVLGISAYVFCGALILLSIMQFMGKTLKLKWSEAVSYAILIIAAGMLLHLKFEIVEIAGHPVSGGGFIGGLLGVVLERYLNKAGAVTVALALFVASFFYASHISVKAFLKGVKTGLTWFILSLFKMTVSVSRNLKSGGRHIWPATKGAVFTLFHSLSTLRGRIAKLTAARKEEPIKVNLPPPRVKSVPSPLPATPVTPPIPPKEIVLSKTEAGPEKVEPRIFARADTAKKPSSSQLELAHISKDYTYPPLSLLDAEEKKESTVDENVLKTNAQMLLKKLEDYGVSGKITEIHPGPVITMFEFEPQAGTKINKIVALADDLAVAMGGRPVRIVPHLPGKAAIGIELPNSTRETVWLKDTLGDAKFIKSHSKLTIGLGKNTQGATVVSDLGKMPHLLIAGATGSGKSVAINTMILSILYKTSPEDVRMIMIDPKTLELSCYNGIPHLLLPVVTKPRDANLSLAWALREMEARYRLLSDVGAKNITTYNAKMEKEGHFSDKEIAEIRAQNPEAVVHTGKLPFIVIVIDELADLMMVSSREIEENVTRLAQMARAAGIHLIVATQRPSVDVITGLIKANFPTRMAFKVSSKHDSRTILDQVGAEHLVGAGDMLFMAPNTSNLVRIHGAFVSEAEIERVVKHLKEQGEPTYNEAILKQPEKSFDDADGEDDELYDMAVKIVAETRQASISMIQRRLRIGYNRAARMIERMEAQGVIGPGDGAKPREILVGGVE